ncbi:MAG: efflux RND transporter periplasmic adaptor subunit [Magnetococcales bacterium]|nr:efflux RND transporter periplasmic adaptor subunit [Magnetococcales bacterium]
MSYRPLFYSLVVAGLLAGGYFYYTGEKSPATVSSKKSGKKSGPAAVTTLRLAEGALMEVVEAVGVLEADTTVTLKSRVDGQVDKVWFREGQVVKQGETLFTLDSRSFDAQLRQAHANLERDTALLAKAQQDLNRSRELERKDLATREKMDNLRAEVASLNATVAADRAQEEHARLMLSYATITSPLEGMTGAILAQPGNTVRQNDTPLVVINRVQPVQVRFAIPEKWLPRVQKRIKEGDLTVQATWSGEKTLTEAGKVIFVNNAVDVATGTLTLKAALPNQDMRLLPGQFVRVTLALGEIKGILVPSKVVQFGQKGSYLYRLKGDGEAEKVPVEVASENEGKMIIRGNLQPDDEVVLEGHLRVNAGDKVNRSDDANHKWKHP